MSAKLRSVVIQQSDDEYAPPEQNVLEVAVIGADVFLTIQKHEETRTSVTYTQVAQVAVPWQDLVRSVLVAIDDPYMFRGVVIPHENANEALSA